MKAIREVCESEWDFILYETDQGFVLNVEYANGIVDFSRSFRVSEEEANQGIESLKQLSERIRNNYESYKDREITPVVRMPK